VQFTYGHFLSVLMKFAIVGFVCWRITIALIKPAKPEEKPATRECPFCRQTIDARATRCAHCTSQLTAMTPDRGGPAPQAMTPAAR
jgi:large conductance mechanosensitive channel